MELDTSQTRAIPEIRKLAKDVVNRIAAGEVRFGFRIPLKDAAYSLFMSFPVSDKKARECKCPLLCVFKMKDNFLLQANTQHLSFNHLFDLHLPYRSY